MRRDRQGVRRPALRRTRPPGAPRARDEASAPEGPRAPPPFSRRAACVLLPALAAAGCKTIEGTRGLPPFYEVYPSSSTTETEGAAASEVYIRPFFSFERRDGDASRLRSFPPFIDLAWSPGEAMYWILPAFFYRAFLQPLGGKDIDWFFLVLFWGGNDPEEGRYFAFLPFAGRLKGLLGLDEADVLMFPLFARTLNGERRSLHILWPFFNRVSGGDWRGWRLWPFYGRYESRYRDGQPRYDRSFVLWPFYIRSHEQLNVNPTDLFFTFPFYGHRVNSRSDTRTYLWPFFQVHDDKKEGRRTYMGFIFPYRFTEGQTDAWPLFGFKETRRLNAPGGEIRHRRRHFILWPIERHDWAEDAREEMTRFWLMPVFWRYQTTDKEKAETDTEWKVWPLCLFRSKAGETAFDFISPLPLYRQDYDRYYGRLFALFRYRSTPALRGWELLYGLLMYRSEVGAAPAPGSGTGGEAAGPSGAGEAAREEAVFSVLGGLFACGRRNGSLVLRFLYIPWW